MLLKLRAQRVPTRRIGFKDEQGRGLNRYRLLFASLYNQESTRTSIIMLENLQNAIRQNTAQTDLPEQVFIEAIEEALCAAARRVYGADANVSVEINLEKRFIKSLRDVKVKLSQVMSNVLNAVVSFWILSRRKPFYHRVRCHVHRTTSVVNAYNV